MLEDSEKTTMMSAGFGMATSLARPCRLSQASEFSAGCLRYRLSSI